MFWIQVLLGGLLVAGVMLVIDLITLFVLSGAMWIFAMLRAADKELDSEGEDWTL